MGGPSGREEDEALEEGPEEDEDEDEEATWDEPPGLAIVVGVKLVSRLRVPFCLRTSRVLAS